MRVGALASFRTVPWNYGFVGQNYGRALHPWPGHFLSVASTCSSVSLSVSIARFVSYFLFHVPFFLDSQQSLICPTLIPSFILSDERASESASPTKGITVEKKHGKKCGPLPQEKLLSLGSRWYTRSRLKWLGVATPRMFLSASMI